MAGKTALKPKEYRFLIPQIRTLPVGTQGEMASSMPYRLEEGITRESILAELKSQPHLAGVARALEAEKQVYLLHGRNREQLELAAQYIGTYHRLGCSKWELSDWEDGCEEDDEEDEQAGDWQSPAPEGEGSFDFSRELPCVSGYEALHTFSEGNDGYGMGNLGFLPQEAGRRTPWWLRSAAAPLLLRWQGGNAAAFVHTLQGMLNLRAFVILLWWERACQIDGCQADELEAQAGYGVEDLAFELETEVISVDSPAADSPYKQQVLCQLAREQGSRLARGRTACAVLHLVEDYRGNVDNHTLSKAVSNALLRRRGSGQLTQRDFAYLSRFAASQTAARTDGPTLVGQKEVERQLRQVVDTLAFQKKRRQLGLPSDPIHCTFAFLGAPGTGKTTWALRLGQEMARLGLLENRESICLNAAELKAKYVGHTTGRVKALFDQYGIIILDEVYSLTEGQDSDCFTQEALAQLCVELENHASDRLVVFAGYGGDGDPRKDRMLRFLQCNPGIRSRVAFKIHFDSFQPQELAEVFCTMLRDKGYEVPAEGAAVAEALFGRLRDRPDFGNCREARNLADRVKVHMAARLTKPSITAQQAVQVLPEDIQAAAADLLAEDRTLHREAPAIGF